MNNQTFNAGSTGAMPYAINAGAQGMKMGTEPVQREIDRSLETLDAVIRGLVEDMRILTDRLSPVIVLRPQDPKDPKDAPSVYGCALASSLENKTDTLRVMRQVVNAILADLQL